MTTGGGVRATALLDLPVRTRGITLGRVKEVVIHAGSLGLVGFDIASRDSTLRFLPRAAARLLERELEVGSALLLLEEAEAAFYRRHSLALAALVGRGVDWERGRSVLVDVVFDSTGLPSAIVVDDDGEEIEAPLSDTVTIGGDRPTRAA